MLFCNSAKTKMRELTLHELTTKIGNAHADRENTAPTQKIQLLQEFEAGAMCQPPARGHCASVHHLST